MPEEQKMIAQNVTFSAEQTGNSTGNDTIGSPIPAHPTAAARTHFYHQFHFVINDDDFFVLTSRICEFPKHFFISR